MWRPYGDPGQALRRYNPMQLSPADALSKLPPMDNIMSNDSRPSATPILHANGTKMMLPPQTRDLAQSLIAHESAAGKTSEPMELAAFRVCETLRPARLCTRGS